MTTEIDFDALEAAYEKALALEKAGDLDAAAAAYAKVLEIDPDDCTGASVRLASMKRGATPDKAPDAYVATLFDQHAEVFESILVDQLGYDVPNLIREAIDALGLGPFDAMLDLGCGTGLAGEALHDICGAMTGLDLSENMIAATAEAEIYESLYVGEAVRFLRETSAQKWDLIVAADVLPYMGALEEFFALAGSALNGNGVFAFSSETLPDEALEGADYMVGAHQRFAHGEAYVRRLLGANGLEIKLMEGIVVRHEEGEPVPGHLVIAQRS